MKSFYYPTGKRFYPCTVITENEDGTTWFWFEEDDPQAKDFEVPEGGNVFIDCTVLVNEVDGQLYAEWYEGTDK